MNIKSGQIPKVDLNVLRPVNLKIWWAFMKKKRITSKNNNDSLKIGFYLTDRKPWKCLWHFNDLLNTRQNGHISTTLFYFRLHLTLLFRTYFLKLVTTFYVHYNILFVFLLLTFFFWFLPGLFLFHGPRKYWCLSLEKDSFQSAYFPWVI